MLLCGYSCHPTLTLPMLLASLSPSLPPSCYAATGHGLRPPRPGGTLLYAPALLFLDEHVPAQGGGEGSRATVEVAVNGWYEVRAAMPVPA
eukprot:1776015-Rhodomonas_salina.1